MKRHLKQLILALLAVGLSLASGPEAFAQMMSSTNYQIPFDAFSDGGGHSTSSNYITEDTVTEQASPTGEGLSSANYLACVGYQCLQEAPFQTVTYAVQSTPCSITSSSAPPYDVPLGTLSTSAVSTASNYRICVRVTSNASGGIVVEGRSLNAALKSTSVPTDMIASATATLTAGSSGYGFCSSQAVNGFTAHAPFNGSCDTGTGNAVGGIATTDQTIWSSSSPVNNAYGELLTKASISATVPAHNDYVDTLTLTVTGTY
jgi:hypothetical protein